MRIAAAALAISVAAWAALVAVQAVAQAPSADELRVAAAKKKAAPKAKSPAKKTPAKKAPAKKKENNNKKEKKGAAKRQPRPGAYADMPLRQRALLQFDLAWAGHYTGLIDGTITDRTVTSVRAYQKDTGHRETGVLSAAEREALAASSKARQERVGWRMVEDRATGAQVGLATKQVPRQSRARRGTRWQSAQGQVQVETFRIREPGTTLASVYEEEKKNRALSMNVSRSNMFFLAGLQGLKKFYVRAEVRDLEIRGITILYDQATEGVMDPIAVVMAGAFSPFSGGLASLIGPPSRRKIEYGTGIVVTPEGHIVTDSKLVEGCSVIEVAGHGAASRVAEYNAASLTLLRLYGGPELTPAALVHAGARASGLTLVGIADPEAQGGRREPSTVVANFANDGLSPPPPLGFAGAAAIDSRGRLFGMVTLKAPVLVSDGPPPLPEATVTPTATIRKFLDARYITPATGEPGADAAKASVVRVICVRR
ncbi:MAG: peptidoglycan-binding domain-containing protein [Xanthobacteraceae bacterium]